MFCFSGLTPDQVKQLEKLFHIYMTPDGRIRYSLKEILKFKVVTTINCQIVFSSFLNLLILTALENIIPT